MKKGRADPMFDPYYWEKITKALLANTVTVPLVIFFLFMFGLVDEPLAKVVEIFQRSYPPFFWPLDRFFDFAEYYVALRPFAEELSIRGPIRILVAVIVFFRKDNWLAYITYWSVGLFFNYQWAANHTVYEPVWLPVFIAGLPWLWLVIRTNRLWPAIFCHATANLSIYFAIKAYQLFS